MTRKADFNAEDWSLILEGPPLAALRVALAARGGTIREMLSITKAYAEERENHGNSELLDAIVSDQPSVKPNRYANEEALQTKGVARLSEALAALERTGTSIEVTDYKRFTYALAKRVARAHKEGGFLGIGGEEISDGEREALAEVAAALSYDPPAESVDPGEPRS